MTIAGGIAGTCAVYTRTLPFILFSIGSPHTPWFVRTSPPPLQLLEFCWFDARCCHATRPPPLHTRAIPTNVTDTPPLRHHHTTPPTRRCTTAPRVLPRCSLRRYPAPTYTLHTLVPAPGPYQWFRDVVHFGDSRSRVLPTLHTHTLPTPPPRTRIPPTRVTLCRAAHPPWWACRAGPVHGMPDADRLTLPRWCSVSIPSAHHTCPPATRMTSLRYPRGFPTLLLRYRMNLTDIITQRYGGCCDLPPTGRCGGHRWL